MSEKGCYWCEPSGCPARELYRRELIKAALGGLCTITGRETNAELAIRIADETIRLLEAEHGK